MTKSVNVALALTVGLVAGVLIGTRLAPQTPDGEGSATAAAATAFAAVPGAIGAEDVSGPYDAADWPKNLSTLPEGNLYTASVDSGLFQKFTPRVGANPAFLMSKGIYSAWQ